MIKDSGDRTEFESGAVRDMHEGKGRCDLMPLDAISIMFGNDTETAGIFKRLDVGMYQVNPNIVCRVQNRATFDSLCGQKMKVIKFILVVSFFIVSKIFTV